MAPDSEPTCAGEAAREPPAATRTRVRAVRERPAPGCRGSADTRQYGPAPDGLAVAGDVGGALAGRRVVEVHQPGGVFLQHDLHLLGGDAEAEQAADED